MEHYAWIFWSIFGVVLIVAEIFTLGFFLLWFGIGALAAALCGLLGFGFVTQFLVFAIVSVTLTALSRTIFINYFEQNGENSLKTGMDSLPGQIGTVKESSNGALNECAVKVFGSTWTAFPEIGEEPLKDGEKVEVTRIQGSSIFVRRHKELPEWREEN
jgi:membrane protein implicated in regulation of membrane protease activity